MTFHKRLKDDVNSCALWDDKNVGFFAKFWNCNLPD
jgi:hypothetical protein